MSAAIIRRAAEWADNAPAEEGYPDTAPRLREIADAVERGDVDCDGLAYEVANEPRALWSGVVVWAESRGMAVMS